MQKMMEKGRECGIVSSFFACFPPFFKGPNAALKTLWKRDLLLSCPLSKILWSKIRPSWKLNLTYVVKRQSIGEDTR